MRNLTVTMFRCTRLFDGVLVVTRVADTKIGLKQGQSRRRERN